MSSLGKDLASIRNKKGLGLEDIQQTTKVPPNILQSIEDDSIFSRMQQNTTYIRSYVRSYAKAVGIKEADIVKALNQEAAGNYDGSLRENKSAGTESAGPDESTDNADKDTPKNGDPVRDRSPKFSFDQNEPDATKNKVSNSSEPANTSHSISSIDWVDVGRRASPDQSRSRIWGGLIIIILIVLALAAIFLLYNYYNSEPSEQPVPGDNSAIFEPENPSDSLRESLITEDDGSLTTRPATPGEDGSLSDTLSLGVYAANGRLEPVRIYTDILARRNPYWIAQGDTLKLNFVNTARILAADQHDRLQLLVNGHPIPDFYQQYFNDETGMIELDRSIFESNPKWRTPAGN